MAYRVDEYIDESGWSQYREWRDKLAVDNPKADLRAEGLINQLKAGGPNLRYPKVSHIRDKIWELRGGEIRIYYWREDAETFIVAAGECKQQGKADERLVQCALDAYSEWNS